MIQQAIGVRAALEASGLDHGPISVHEKMRALGMDPVPSTASLARIFRDQGVAQLDATEYVLIGGRKCVMGGLLRKCRRSL